ncbi:Superfamily II DNA and RNA helicase [Raineyella antarctica]|uniref:Superfamily II DNA and RNA helicase n=1 Tax=Raineyella antarctica TaxID=1577474 RepID=A0A1G6I0Z5_9ACTN|nr:DEAD/DEAH box helicase [Raineyella antarctica]SDC00120.1 Superfamily II DNA and RNA helicase [Raineyella antarctica]
MPYNDHAPKSGGPRKAKSFKADGTPKKRWTTDERSARGHGPRSRGGQRDTDSRGGQRDTDSRSFSREDRGQGRTSDRGPEAYSGDGRSYGDDRRQAAAQRRGGTDRPAGGNRYGNDRGGNDRGGYAKKSTGRFNRDDRPSYNRDDRSRDDRPAFNRDDRPRNDRPGYNRDDRPRNDRPGYNRDDRSRNDRPGFNRDDRPRNDRPGFNRDDRSRGDRPGFNRDDRPRDDRPSYNRNDRDDRSRGDRHEGTGSSFGRSRAPYGSRPTYGGASRGQDGATHGSYQDRPKKKAWGRDVDPERDMRPREDRPRREERRFDDRPRRDNARFDRNDRPERRDDREDGPLDTMDWQEAEEVAVDTSTVTGANGFAQLGVPAELVAVLNQKGITDPFPIQKASIPDALAGKDVLGRGRTGSGKTLGFTLPLLARIHQTAKADGTFRKPQAIILEPTRELAMQVADVLSPLSRALGMRSLLVAGGMSYEPQRRALSRGVDVIIATPGRLIDLIEQGAADLSDIQVTVLDEADEMADMGFMPEVTRIMDETPSEGQRLLFSATLDKGVDGLVKRYMHSPKVHEVDSSNATFTTMEHHLVLVKPEHKAPITAEIANREGKTIVFARTQKGVDRISGELREAGVMAGGLHGGLTQGARARVMAAFKDGTMPVLVATDVAARGIHVDDVGLVLQVDPPADSRDYTHRAGRTARAGSEGIVVSLILPHQRKQSLRLAYQAGVQDKAREARPDEEWLYRATGARKPSAEPIEESEYEALIAPKQQPRRGGGRRFGGNKPFNRGGRRFRD